MEWFTFHQESHRAVIEKSGPDKFAELLAPPERNGSATVIQVSAGFLGFDMTIKDDGRNSGFMIQKVHTSCLIKDYIRPGDAIMMVNGMEPTFSVLYSNSRRKLLISRMDDNAVADLAGDDADHDRRNGGEVADNEKGAKESSNENANAANHYEDEPESGKYSYPDVEEASVVNKYSIAPFYDMEFTANHYKHLRDNKNNPPPLGVCRLYKPNKDRSKHNFFNVPGQGVQDRYTIVPQQVFETLRLTLTLQVP